MSFFFRGSAGNQKEEKSNDDSSNLIETSTGDLSGGINDLINDLEVEEQTLLKKSKDKLDQHLLDTSSTSKYN